MTKPKKRNQVSIDLDDRIYLRLVEETREKGCLSIQELIRVILGERYNG